MKDEIRKKRDTYYCLRNWTKWMTSAVISAGRIDLGNRRKFGKSQAEEENDGPCGEKDPLFIGESQNPKRQPEYGKAATLRIQDTEYLPFCLSLFINAPSFRLTPSARNVPLLHDVTVTCQLTLQVPSTDMPTCHAPASSGALYRTPILNDFNTMKPRHLVIPRAPEAWGAY